MSPTPNPGRKVKTAIRNLGSSHLWYPLDMVNWHRMVRPLRNISAMGEGVDFFQLLVTVCTRMDIRYVPAQQRPSLEMPAARSPRGGARPGNEPRVALFVDCPDHVSGVATTLRHFSQEAHARSLPFQLLHTGAAPDFPHSICFKPLGTLHLDAYKGLTLHVPHVKQVIRHIQEHPADLIHVSTPGPMGLMGLLAGSILNVPVCGTYHTDLPRYMLALTGDEELERLTWQYLRWIYGQMRQVAVPSPTTRTELLEHGFDPHRVSVVGRGVDAQLFSPQQRDEKLRRKWGFAHCLLYAGRVSREKNLPCLVECFQRLCRERKDVGLIVTGDGPYLEEMRRLLQDAPAVFTGFKSGRELAQIYASCDLFVFPSLTDTLGVVLLEAQASGLPVVVAGSGGPRDCIRPGETGVVVEPMTPDTLRKTLLDLLRDEPRRQAMGQAAPAHARQSTWTDAFNAFWELHRVAKRREPDPQPMPALTVRRKTR